MEQIQLYLSAWFGGNLLFEIGKCLVPASTPAKVLPIAVLLSIQQIRDARQVKSPQVPANELFARKLETAVKIGNNIQRGSASEDILHQLTVYNRTQRVFVDLDQSLRGVAENDHIVVSRASDQATLDQRFTPEKTHAFDRAVRDILDGR